MEQDRNILCTLLKIYVHSPGGPSEKVCTLLENTQKKCALLKIFKIESTPFAMSTPGSARALCARECTPRPADVITPCLMRTWKKSCLATMNLFSGLIYPVFWLLITSFH